MEPEVATSPDVPSHEVGLVREIQEGDEAERGRYDLVGREAAAARLGGDFLIEWKFRTIARFSSYNGGVVGLNARADLVEMDG